MSFAQIEAELEQLSSEELRRLALKTWATFLKKESMQGDQCSEHDPELLAELDNAIESADNPHVKKHSAGAVRAQLSEWSSR